MATRIYNAYDAKWLADLSKGKLENIYKLDKGESSGFIFCCEPYFPKAIAISFVASDIPVGSTAGAGAFLISKSRLSSNRRGL